jgi:hypothetical protein
MLVHATRDPGGASPPLAVDVVRALALIDRSKLVVDGGLSLGGSWGCNLSSWEAADRC